MHTEALKREDSVHTQCPWQAYVSAHVVMCLCVWIGNVEEEDRTALVEKGGMVGVGLCLPLKASENPTKEI